MDLELILKRLGVASGEAALAAIDRWNNMLASLMTLCSVSAPQAAMDMLQQMHKALGGFGPEALARVEAWRASAERVPELEQQLSAIRAKQQDAEANTLMQQASQQGKLPPAHKEKAERLYRDHGIAALTAFLEALPVQTNPAPRDRELRQPPPSREPGAAPQLSASQREYLKATGRTVEDIEQADKLWEETNGVVTEATMRELNNKQLKTFEAMPALRAG